MCVGLLNIVVSMNELDFPICTPLFSIIEKDLLNTDHNLFVIDWTKPIFVNSCHFPVLIRRARCHNFWIVTWIDFGHRDSSTAESCEDLECCRLRDSSCCSHLVECRRRTNREAIGISSKCSECYTFKTANATAIAIISSKVTGFLARDRVVGCVSRHV